MLLNMGSPPVLCDRKGEQAEPSGSNGNEHTFRRFLVRHRILAVTPLMLPGVWSAYVMCVVCQF